MPSTATKKKLEKKNHRAELLRQSQLHIPNLHRQSAIRGQTNPFPYKSVLNLSKLDSSVTLLWHFLD